MPNKNSKSKKRERSISPRSIAPSPVSVASNTSSINEFSKEILDNPNNLPIATNFKIMSNEVASFKPYKVQKVFREFKKTGGKKNKRITIKKKKTRKTLKKPLFKRNKV
tara:strand:- start:34 stop:360 length:327 start_codon:yes stop_codon:yes gene_type:complete